MLFNRYIEVVIMNYDTNEEIRVNSTSDIRIDFDYNEHLDQNAQTNTGTIKIYNLSTDTIKRIGRRLRTEVMVFCGYVNRAYNSVDRLCCGGILSVKRVREGGDMVTVIEFQTAIRELNTGFKIGFSAPENESFMNILMDALKSADFTAVMEVTKEQGEEHPTLIDSITSLTLPHGLSIYGTPQQVINQLCEMFALSYRIDPIDPRHIIYFIKDEHVEKFMKIVSYSAKGGGSANGLNITDLKNTALLLSPESGLVGTPTIETIEINTSYNEALDENEELIKQKAIVPKRNSKGEVMKDKAGNVKYTKPPKTKRIARLVVRAQALINPNIKPNRWVYLDGTSGDLDGFYIVRNITYKGSTHNPADFIMDMTLTYRGDRDIGQP